MYIDMYTHTLPGSLTHSETNGYNLRYILLYTHIYVFRFTGMVIHGPIYIHTCMAWCGSCVFEIRFLYNVRVHAHKGGCVCTDSA